MKSFRRAWRTFWWSLRQHGASRTARQVLRRVAGSRGEVKPAVHPFDEDYGTETSGLISGGELSSGQENDRFSTAYYGVSPSRMRGALERWRETRGTGDVREYTFVDIGSGKGRAMMIASELPFREVAGVELNLGLHELAERNLAVWRDLGRALSAMRLVQGDALSLEIPMGRLLIFLYNPFLAPVVRGLLKRIDAEAGERRGEIDLLYVVPEQEAAFAEFPQFELLWSELIGMSVEDAAADQVSSPGDRVSLYRR